MSVPIQSSATSPAAGRIDFGWIGQAWALSKARPGVWAGALLLFFLISIALWLLWAIPTGGLASLQRTYVSVISLKPPPVAAHPYRDFAQTHLLGLLTAGVEAVFTGGLYRMALRQKRGEAISALDLFSALPWALPLALVGVAVPAALDLLEGLCLWLLHFSLSPAAAVSDVEKVSSYFRIAVTGLFMFAPLLVLDAGAGAPDALLGSVRLLRGQVWRGIGFYLVASFVGGIGVLLCGVGMLATYPVFLISVVLGYLALTRPAVSEPPPVFDPAAGVWPPPPQVPQ